MAARHHLILHFDGGSRGNPGPGYGSYVLMADGREQRRRRLDFGPHRTNNEAEYEALLAGLQDTLAWLAEQRADPAQASLEVRGDSQLVIRQLQGAWRCREPRMAVLCSRAQALLQRFGRRTLRLVPREKTMEVLGH